MRKYSILIRKLHHLTRRLLSATPYGRNGFRLFSNQSESLGFCPKRFLFVPNMAHSSAPTQVVAGTDQPPTGYFQTEGLGGGKEPIKCLENQCACSDILQRLCWVSLSPLCCTKSTFLNKQYIEVLQSSLHAQEGNWKAKILGSWDQWNVTLLSAGKRISKMYRFKFQIR